MENELQILNTFFSATAFVLGCMVGSFLNVCICRLPNGESVVKPRSRCPKCGNAIAWYDNLPILSWLILSAKCRQCGEVISWQYPLVEALTGVSFLCVFLRFGPVLAAPIYMLLMAGLILITFVDLTDWTIPNEVTFPGIFAGIGCSVVGMVYPESGLLVTSVFDALIACVAGGGILYLLDKLTLLLLKKRGMGFGDVKLLAMLGACLGWRSIPFIIMAASLLGSVVGLSLILAQRRMRTKDDSGEGEMQGHYLPFGPYLAVAGVIFLFFGQAIINAYLGYLIPPEATPILPIQ